MLAFFGRVVEQFLHLAVDLFAHTLRQIVAAGFLEYVDRVIHRDAAVAVIHQRDHQFRGLGIELVLDAAVNQPDFQIDR